MRQCRIDKRLLNISGKTWFMKSKAFSVLELLVLIAIVAILLAVVMPNVFDSKVRAKVGQAKSDLRRLSTALDAYFVDHKAYPPTNGWGVVMNSTAVGGKQDWLVLERLSTPVAYIEDSFIPDSFKPKYRSSGIYGGPPGVQPGLTIPLTSYTLLENTPLRKNHFYMATGNTGGLGRAPRPAGTGGQAFVVPPPNQIPADTYSIHSSGPDQIYFNMGGILGRSSLKYYSTIPEEKVSYNSNLIYDATNGTVSFGSIFRAGGDIDGDYAHFHYQVVNGNYSIPPTAIPTITPIPSPTPTATPKAKPVNCSLSILTKLATIALVSLC